MNLGRRREERGLKKQEAESINLLSDFFLPLRGKGAPSSSPDRRILIYMRSSPHAKLNPSRSRLCHHFASKRSYLFLLFACLFKNGRGRLSKSLSCSQGSWTRRQYLTAERLLLCSKGRGGGRRLPFFGAAECVSLIGFLPFSELDNWMVGGGGDGKRGKNFLFFDFLLFKRAFRDRGAGG